MTWTARVGWRTAAVAAAAVAIGATPAAAQLTGISVNPYIGYYHFDESSFEKAFDRTDIDSKPPLYGVRLGIGGHQGWSLDLGYGRTSVEGEFDVGDVVMTEDATIQLFYGALDYHLPLPILDVFISGGAGALRYDPDERDSQTNTLLNFGAGVTVPLGGLRLRADVKDHVSFCEAPDSDRLSDFSACFDDATRHDIEISAGVELSL